MDERVVITFERGDRRFNLPRAVAVILDKEQRRVVIHRASHEDFFGPFPAGALNWVKALPKPSCAKCVRKWGSNREAGRLLWVVEGFVTFLETLAPNLFLLPRHLAIRLPLVQPGEMVGHRGRH